MRIYVASSWRNLYHAQVVRTLRGSGHVVYDFKDADGFHWEGIDPKWREWSPKQYLDGLINPVADRGFARDMAALAVCQVCIMVMPCGLSAGLELGYAVGAGKRTAVYVPELREPDLMVKMADMCTYDFGDLLDWVNRQ